MCYKLPALGINLNQNNRLPAVSPAASQAAVYTQGCPDPIIYVAKTLKEFNIIYDGYFFAKMRAITLYTISNEKHAVFRVQTADGELHQELRRQSPEAQYQRNQSAYGGALLHVCQRVSPLRKTNPMPCMGSHVQPKRLILIYTKIYKCGFFTHVIINSAAKRIKSIATDTRHYCDRFSI